MVSWCSWLSRQSNTLKVSGSTPGEAILFTSLYLFYLGRDQDGRNPPVGFRSAMG